MHHKLKHFYQNTTQSDKQKNTPDKCVLLIYKQNRRLTFAPLWGAASFL